MRLYTRSHEKISKFYRQNFSKNEQTFSLFSAGHNRKEQEGRWAATTLWQLLETVRGVTKGKGSAIAAPRAFTSGGRRPESGDGYSTWTTHRNECTRTSPWPQMSLSCQNQPGIDQKAFLWNHSPRHAKQRRKPGSQQGSGSVHVYMYVCTYIYIYIYIYIYVHIHIYTHTCVCVHMCLQERVERFNVTTHGVKPYPSSLSLYLSHAYVYIMCVCVHMCIWRVCTQYAHRIVWAMIDICIYEVLYSCTYACMLRSSKYS